MDISPWLIDYGTLLNEGENSDNHSLPDFLAEELPYLWFAAYKSASSHEANVNRFWHNTFEYIFDDCSTSEIEARLVAVVGKSNPVKKLRAKDDNRLKGWIGPTQKTFGHEWDKGHFIAHSIGGAIDGVEVNVFPQKRAINRGRSSEGVLFRQMEIFCGQNPGTFCFNRPLYRDESARPAYFEFGVLKPDNTLWVHLFDNR
ncbi:MAG TPA: hypothetical protein VK476_01510 [Flavobacterium sp.]|nr:hypothetical protein [Flavobacterium sp.]